MLDVLEALDVVVVLDVGPTVAWPLEPPVPKPAESRKQPLGAVSPTQDKATSTPAPSTIRCRSIHEAIVPPSANAKTGPRGPARQSHPFPALGKASGASSGRSVGVADGSRCAAPQGCRRAHG